LTLWKEEEEGEDNQIDDLWPSSLTIFKLVWLLCNISVS
jgi:hypothetical protein